MGRMSELEIERTNIINRLNAIQKDRYDILCEYFAYCIAKKEKPSDKTIDDYYTSRTLYGIILKTTEDKNEFLKRCKKPDFLTETDKFLTGRETHNKKEKLILSNLLI